MIYTSVLFQKNVEVDEVSLSPPCTYYICRMKTSINNFRRSFIGLRKNSPPIRTRKHLSPPVVTWPRGSKSVNHTSLILLPVVVPDVSAVGSVVVVIIIMESSNELVYK
jgi:hypothetical protein